MQHRKGGGPKESHEYDEAGERVVRELPPGLYFHPSIASSVVKIDRDHRARIYLFVPGGGRRDGHPYRGYVFGLARAAFEGILCDYMGWEVPGPPDRTDGFEEARAVTPWAYRALERRSRG